MKAKVLRQGLPPSVILIMVLGLCSLNLGDAEQMPSKSNLKKISVLEHGAGAGYLASCEHLNASLRELGAAHGFIVDVIATSANLADAFSSENLAKYQVVIIAYNDGVHRFISGAARDNFEKYVENGGGLLAINAASAFIVEWPWIDSVLVQKFYAPWQNNWPAADLKQDAEGLKLDTETRGITKDLTAPSGFRDAFYQFKATPRGNPGVTVLLTVDEKSGDANWMSPMGADHPVAWTKTVGKGRVVHNSLGFSNESLHLNAYTQKGDYLKSFTYTSLRYAAGDFVGCMDDKFAEYNPGATKSDPAQCITTTAALVRFNKDRKQSSLPLISQNESGTLVNVEFFKQGLNALSITDISGKLIYQKTGSGQASYSVPTPQKSGIYIVKAKSGSKVITHRVTVL